MADIDWSSWAQRSMHPMVSVHDEDGKYIWASKASKGLLGRPPEDIIGTNAYEYFHPRDLDAITRGHATNRAGDGESTVVYRVRNGNGWRWVETTSHTEIAPDGERRIVAVTRRLKKRPWKARVE